MAEAYTSIQLSAHQGGLLGALQNSKYANGSVSGFLHNSATISNAFALISQDNVQQQGELTAQIAAANLQQSQLDRLNKLLNPPAQTNYNPPKQLDPVIYFANGSTLDTANNILTLSDGKQIDTTTGNEYVDESSLIRMANGAYLDTKNNVLVMANGTKIDAVTGLILSTTA